MLPTPRADASSQRGSRGGAVTRSALGQVLLVVLLGAVELGGGGDLGDDRAAVPAAALEGFLRGTRGGLLLRRVKEDGRPVLRADVGTLAIHRGGVVAFPERLQQRVVGHLGGIVL